MLYRGDCREVLPALAGVDLVFASPPYLAQRRYGGAPPLSAEAWMALMVDAFGAVAPGAQQLVNLGLIYRERRALRYWEPWLDAMDAAGWYLAGWYVWDQRPGLPGNWNGRCGPAHEWVFHLARAERALNCTVPNKLAGRRARGGLRNRNGFIEGFKGPIRPARVLDSVVSVGREKDTSPPWAEHPARGPVALPAEYIPAFTDRGGLVVDPFCGTGTTGVAAWQAGRRFIGIEVDPDYFAMAVQRLRAATAQQLMRLAAG